MSVDIAHVACLPAQISSFFFLFFFSVQHVCLLPVADLIVIGACRTPAVAWGLGPRFCRSAHIISELSEFKIRYENNYLDQKRNHSK